MEKDQRECPRCKGSGEREYMTSHLGPNDYEVTGPCDECGGAGDEPVKDCEAAHETMSIAIYKSVTGKSDSDWCREPPKEWGRWRAAAIAAMSVKG